jgi:hypothetical protein
MPYVIRFTNPAGEVTYMPEGFGFTSHAHVSELALAARFEDPRHAQQRLSGYILPDAFWDSERRHRELMIEKFRGWKCEVVKLKLTKSQIRALRAVREGTVFRTYRGAGNVFKVPAGIGASSLRKLEISNHIRDGKTISLGRHTTVQIELTDTGIQALTTSKES